MDKIQTKKNFVKRFVEILFILIMLLLLFTAKIYSYILFHSLVEFISAFVFISIFMLIWNLKKYFDDGFFIILGITCLFIGIVDILHLLSYKGINIFTGFDTNLPTQLWTAGRILFSSSLIVASLFFGRKIKLNLFFLFFTLIFIILLMSIFYFKIFPVCYIEGIGLTPFKKISEYIISLLFIVSILILYIKRSYLNKGLLILFITSISVSILSELCFTVYNDPYSTFNFIGHMLKIISVYLIYRAIIQKGLRYPFDMMFHDLMDKEESLKYERDKLTLYLNNSAEIVVIINPDQKVAMINRKGCDLLGYPEKEILGKNWFENFIPERIKDEANKEFSYFMESKIGINLTSYFENPIITKDGNELLIAWHNCILKDNEGNIIAILSSGNDITGRKQIEEQIIHLASFPELNDNPICEIDIKGSIEYLNPTIKKIFPDIEELQIKHKWFSSIDKITNLFLEKKLKNYKREIRINDFYYDQNIVFTEKYNRIRIYGHDITERKIIEMAMQKSEERFRLVLDNSPIAISNQDMDLVYTWVYNPRLGFTQTEAVGKKDSEIFPAELAEEIIKMKKKVIEEKKEIRKIVKIALENGIIYHDTIVSPVLDENNECTGVTTIAIDITENTKLEVDNVLSKFCMDKAAEGFVWIESNSNIIYANEKACQMYEYTVEELLSMTLHDIAPNFKKERWPDRWDSIKQHSSYLLEAEHMSKNGRKFPVEVIVNYIKFGDKEFICSIIRDITERRKMEELLKRSHNELEYKVNQRTVQLHEKNEMLNEKISELRILTDEITEQSRILEAFFKHTMTSIVFLDKNFNFKRVNEAYLKASRIDIEDFKEKNYFEIYPSDELKEKFINVLDTHEIYQANSRPFIFPDHPERGTTYWDFSAVPINNQKNEVDYLVLALNDVTERIRASNLLRESEEMFRTVLENLPVGIWIVDKKGTIIHGNPAGKKIWEGYRYVPVDQYLEYKGWWCETGKLIKQDEWAAYRAVIKGETSINEEIEIECFDKTHKIISNSALPIKNSENEITGAIILNQDITERKFREKNIIVTNNLLQLLENSNLKNEYLSGVVSLLSDIGKLEFAGIRLINEKGNMPYVSYKGFNNEYIKFENFISLEKDLCLCTRIVNGNVSNIESSFLTKGGSFYCNNFPKFISEIEINGGSNYFGKCISNEFNSVLYVPIKYGDKNIGLIHFADKKEGAIKNEFVELLETLRYFIGEGIHKYSMSEKIQETEKELLLAKRLSDIGALAATVAHELRNPLAAIMMAAYNIKNKAKNPDLDKHLLNIEKKVSEGDQIIKNLLFYTRIKTADVQKTNLYEILDDCIETINSRFQRNVSLIRKFENLKNKIAEVDPLLIKELFENLLNNAYDSMINKNGILEIRSILKENEIEIYFKDNGCGIDTDDIDRIFEPFFSTKSKGTGLGLSVCRQIIILHHGDIRIESKKDEGTTIMVILPWKEKYIENNSNNR